MEWAWFSFSKAQLTIRGTITEWILQVYPWPSSLNEKQWLRTNLVVPCVCRWYSNGILNKGRDWKRFISTSKRVHPHHCTWHLPFPTDECQGWHGKGHQGKKTHQNIGVEVQFGDNKENEDTSSHSSIGKQPQGVYCHQILLSSLSMAKAELMTDKEAFCTSYTLACLIWRHGDITVWCNKNPHWRWSCPSSLHRRELLQAT